MSTVSHKDFMLYMHNLVGYNPDKPEAFQWPIDESCMEELVAYMKEDKFINGHLVLNNHPNPIKGYIKRIDGRLYFQLTLNAEVAKSVIPPVPDHVRQAALARDRSG